MTTVEPYWGMHAFWWFFWIIAMVSVFGFNVPERTRFNSQDPLMILKRRRAKGEINEEEYKSTQALFLQDETLINQDLNAQTVHTKTQGHPLVDGLSFSVTWAISYSLCALIYWISPDAITSATSKLFHGMSFTQMAQAGTAFTLGDFISVLTIGAVYTFITGIVWSLTHSFFLQQRGEYKLARLENRRLQKPRLST